MGGLARLQALILAATVLVLGLIALLAALVLAQGRAFDAWWKIVLFSLLPVVLIEGAVQQTLVALSIDPSRVARLAGGRASAAPVLGLLVAIVFAAGVAYVIGLLATNAGAFVVGWIYMLFITPPSDDVKLVLAVIAAYVVTRPVLTRLPSMGDWIAPASTYRLSADAVTIVPAPFGVRRFIGARPAEFTVPFAELEQMEALSGSGEADAVASALGISKRLPADTNPAAESNSFQGYYWEGEPSRPTVMLAYGQVGRPVALVGPDRRYVVSFRDTDELIAAWQRHRGRTRTTS